jgi:hypothetical protein
MARRASKFLVSACVLGLVSGPAFAQNYDYLSHSDTISVTAGDANAANIVIQTPTPWPYYINQTKIRGDGPRSVIIIRKYQGGPTGQASDTSAAPSTNLPPGQ